MLTKSRKFSCCFRGIEGDEDAIEELESVIRNEPDYFDHIAQKCGAPGNAIVEEAGHYAESEALYVSAANRAEGGPATDEDANAYLINTNYLGHGIRPVD